MQLILFLSVSITAFSLKKYENGLLDELNDWNPSWKKGLASIVHRCYVQIVSLGFIIKVWQTAERNWSGKKIRPKNGLDFCRTLFFLSGPDRYFPKSVYN